MVSNLSKEEKKWRAESDASTLAEAEAIKSDKSRLKAAAAEARKMAKDAENRAKGMKRVAKFSKGKRKK